MFKSTTLRKFYPLLVLFLMLCMCTSGSNGNYSDWYDENPEEDILTGMLGGSDTQDSSQPDDSSNFDWGPEGQPQPNDNQDAAPDSSVLLPAVKTQPVTIMGHIPEFRSEIFKEKKSTSQNSVELGVANKIRIKTIKNAEWRSFSGARVSAEDNQDLNIKYVARNTNGNGNFTVVLEPADPYRFFSFVPFAETGFTPHNYSIPVEALHLNTLTFNLVNDEGVWHKYRYSYQTYDLRPTIESFVKMEIESQTRKVTLDLYDAESRYPVRDAKVTITSTPPTRLRLLLKYFKNIELLQHALTVAPDYAVNSSSFYSDMDGDDINMFFPYEYTVEISHPDYFFTTETLSIKKDTESFPIALKRLYTNAKIVHMGAAQ